MPVFGSFETLREVARTGLGAVFVARRVGTTDERYAVKLHQPPEYMMDESEIERSATLFLSAAEAQRGAAQAGAGWATVYESGRAEGGAWYATDLFERSVHRLVLHRHDMEARELLRLIESMFAGLGEMRDALGRSHGNLKDTNVLIAGKGDLSTARVMLCDPEASERLRGGESRLDLREIGDLMHRLVLHRPMKGPAGWPVGPSQEWQRLGRVGENWLKLMNMLLDPTNDALTLDEAWRAVPGGTVRPGSSTTEIPTPIARGGKGDSARSDAIKSDGVKSRPVVTPVTPKSEPPPPPTPAPPPVRMDEPRVEPAIVAPVDVPAEPAPAPMAERPPSRPPAPQPVPQPTPTPVAMDADVTQDLPSHESGAAAVEASKSRVPSGAPAKTPAANVEASMARSRAASLSNVGRVSAASVAGDAPKSFEELERESERRKTEPKKAGAGKWIGIGIGAVGLVAVAAIVIANLPKDDPNKGGGKIAIEPPKPGPKPDPKPEPVKENPPAPDPRLAATEASLDGIARAIEAGRRFAEDSPGESIESMLSKVTGELVGQAEGREAKRRGVHARALRLGAITRATSVASALEPASQGESEAREGVSRVIELLTPPKAGDVAALQARAGEFARLLSAAGGLKDGTLKDRAGKHAADAYVKWFDGLAPGVAEVASGEGAASSFGVADAAMPGVVKVSRLLRGLENLQDKGEGARRVEAARREITQKYPALAAAANAELDRLAKVYETKVAVTPDPVPAPTPTPPPVNPNAAKIAAANGAIKKIVENLAAGLDAGEAPGGGQSIQALLALVPADLEADAIGSDAALDTALARARGLGAIASIGGADAAATRAADESEAGNASGSIAAGRRALALVKDGAPGDLAAVESTGAILERVREAARALPDAAKAKRDALAKDADDRRRALFVTSVKGVKVDDAAAIGKAMAMAAGFGATAEDIPAKARLNLLVLALKDEVDKASDDAAAKAAADKFRAGAGALGPSVAAEVGPIVTALDAAEKEPVATGGGGVNFATAGPGSAGWSAKPGADGASVVYTSTSLGQSIEFIRVAGTETFLSATEVTIGVFRDAAFGKPVMTRLAKRADLVGPIGWQPKGQGDLEPARGKGSVRGADKFGWLETAPGLQNSGQSPYPAELESKVGAPSASHPMQQVSARAAGEAAAAIGCRLPTAPEWEAAGMGSKVDGSANRRDAAWKAMRDHMIGVTQGAAKPRFDTLPWPDDGAFVPTGVKVPVRMDAVEVDGGDDGTVWFRTAPSPDGRFHDLVGNVAEWVLAPGAAPGQAQVIGGSAMSAKEIPVNEAQRATGAATSGFADVGFRLAFDASGGGSATAALPLAGRLKNAADALSLVK